MPSLQQRIEEGLGLYPTSRVGDEETPGLVVTAGHIFSLILTQTYPSLPPHLPSPPFAGDFATDDDDKTTPDDSRVFFLDVGQNHEPLQLAES